MAVWIRLFGAPQIEHDGQIVAIDTRKALALLAYMALAERPLSRATAAALLWPSYDQQRAFANLRRTLWALNRAVGAGFLHIHGDLIGLSEPAMAAIDVVRFQRCLAERHPQALQEAVDLAAAPFLEGFSLPDAIEFDDWQTFTSARLQANLASALRQLVDTALEQGGDRALPAAERWVQLEPFENDATMALMRAYHAADQATAALHAYRQFERRLAAELGAAPDPALTELFERIRRGQPPRSTASQLQPNATLAADRSDLPLQPPTTHHPDATGAGEVQQVVQLFVAREAEVAYLEQQLHMAQAGQGRLCWIQGEAGQGKTVLLHGFARHVALAQPDVIVLFGSCDAYTGIGDPYTPFREILVQLVGLERSSPAIRQHLPDTIACMLDHAADLCETFVPLAALLAHMRGELPTALVQRLEAQIAQRQGFDPTRQQASLFGQYIQLLAQISQKVPIVLLLDDLQWGDAASLALLFQLSRRLQGMRVLIVAAYRPNDLALGRDGDRHPLDAIIHEYQRIAGDQAIDLAQAHGQAFIDALIESEPNRLDHTFRQELYRQTNGHPLFTHELLRGMQERGEIVRDSQGYWMIHAPINWQQLPARVEAVIAERISRLPAILRNLLRAASIEGEEFHAEVAAQLIGMDAHAARRLLSNELERTHRLVRAVDLLRIGDQRLSRYRFQHFLIQRSLANGLDISEQGEFHEEAARMLERIYAGQTEPIALALAQHYAAANIPHSAIRFYQQAGDRATRLSANTEAASHYRRALDLLAQLPSSTEHLEWELELQAAYSIPLQHVEGWASHEVDRTFERAQVLARQFGNPTTILPLLARIAHAYVYRGEHRRALTLAEELLSRAHAEEDPDILLEAYTVVGLAHFYRGEFVQSLPYIESALAIYQPGQHRQLFRIYGQDPGVHAGLYRMLVLLMLGDVVQAYAQMEATIELAEQSQHPFTMAFAWSFVSWACALAHDNERSMEAAKRSLSLADRYSFPTWQAMGHIANGFFRAMVEQPREGLAQLQHGFELAARTGAQTPLPFLIGLTSQLYRILEQPDEAAKLLVKAIQLAEKNEEGDVLPDLYRQQADLLAEQGAPWPEITKCLDYARTLARQQQARLHELRILTTYTKLCLQYAPDQAAAIRTELAQAYQWFDQTANTADLQAARALLNNEPMNQ
ncbi:MAG: hypothetical protein Fur005_45070 [Roseiflexaceae bacterium]